MALARHVVFFDAYPHSYTGTARSAALFALELPEHGISAEVLLPSEGPVADAMRNAGVTVTIVPAPAALGYYGRTTKGARLLRALVALPGYWRRLGAALRARPGVVHVTSHRSVLLAAPAARLARRPILWQVSGIESDQAVSAVCELIASRTIAVSTLARPRTFLRRRPGIHRVVPPPLDPRFDDAPPAQPVSPPVVVTAGRLEPAKGHLLLFEAFSRVRHEVPEARLRVIGGEQVGHEAHAATVRATASRFPDGSVELTGWVAEPERCWLDASVYVHAAAAEGLGLTIAEAMACGIPAVMTKQTGLADHLVDGRDALVVDADPQALADAVVGLLRDRDRAHGIGASGRSAVRRLALPRVAGELATVVDEVLGAEGAA